MFELIVAAAAVAGLADVGPADPTDTPIIVEGRRSTRDWELPDLDYDEPAACPALVETELPGFGVMRLRKRCASDGTEERRLFQH